MKVVDKILFSDFSRRVYFLEDAKVPINETELSDLKATILPTIKNLQNSNREEDKTKLKLFWEVLDDFYKELLWVLRFTNKKYWLAYDYNLNKAQRIFYRKNRHV